MAKGAATHALPHAPQFLMSDEVTVSQPFIALLSQFAKPVLHAPSAHIPPVHAGAAFANPMHGLPQPPQFVGSLAVADSQPFIATRSQSWKPGLHVATAHAPATHFGVAFGSAHCVVHEPQ